MTDPLDPTTQEQVPAEEKAAPEVSAASDVTDPTAEIAQAAETAQATEVPSDVPAAEAAQIAEAQTDAIEGPVAADASNAPIAPAPGSIFQDRALTAVEMKRLDVARMQPKPWEPTDDDLDPTKDVGWDVAAGHELIAVRPEDVAPSQPFVATSAAAASAAAATAAPAAPVVPAAPPGPRTAALTWATAASAIPAPGIVPAPGTIPAPGTMPAPAATSAFPTPSIVPSTESVPGLTPASGLAPFAPALAVVAPVEVVPAGPPWWRRAAVSTKTSLKAIARPMSISLLFVVGLGFGYLTFLRSQPVPQQPIPVAAAPSDGTTAVVPAQILSLIDALQSDNQTKVQLVVPAQPYRLLAGELAVDGISQIVGAKALQTYTDGSDSATEILITGLDQTGNALTFNLVVHLHDGAITDFR